MKNTNPIFSLKNFRSFGEEGADFELAPITVLTGCNSAGKSSLVKALMLLAKQSQSDLPIPTQAVRNSGHSEFVGSDLPVTDKQFGLGNINKVINRISGNGKIEYSYTVWSAMLNEEVRVIKTFRPAQTNIIPYGELASWRIEKYDGTLLVEHNEKGNVTDQSVSEFLSHFNITYDGPIRSILGDSKIKDFYKEVLRDVPFLSISSESYIDSRSSIIKRLYTLDDDDKLSITLRKLYERGREYDEYLRREGPDNNLIEPLSFVDQWMYQFGLCDEVKVIPEGAEGLGIYLYLLKGEERYLLADEGYGITQLLTLLLHIDNCLPNYSLNKKPQWICVEEPEIHLHPAYQSKLADMFVEAYQKYNIHFIIETHSEYLIRKLQVLVADKENKLTPNDVSLNYVDKDENGISTNRKIEILEDGRLSGPFGPGFFDEADSLAMDLMKYKVRR